MHRTAHTSFLAVTLAGAMALFAPRDARASSSDNGWSHPLNQNFDWSVHQFDLNAKSRFGGLTLSQQISQLFFALDSAWVHAGGDPKALQDLWSSSWTQISPGGETPDWKQERPDDSSWRHDFDEWAFHHHYRIAVCSAPDDPQGPTIPEPMYYGAMMSATAAGIVLLRKRRQRPHVAARPLDA